jgi:hypothetical protein
LFTVWRAAPAASRAAGVVVQAHAGYRRDARLGAKESRQVMPVLDEARLRAAAVEVVLLERERLQLPHRHPVGPADQLPGLAIAGALVEQLERHALARGAARLAVPGPVNAVVEPPNGDAFAVHDGSIHPPLPSHGVPWFEVTLNLCSKA